MCNFHEGCFSEWSQWRAEPFDPESLLVSYRTLAGLFSGPHFRSLTQDKEARGRREAGALNLGPHSDRSAGLVVNYFAFWSRWGVIFGLLVPI